MRSRKRFYRLFVFGGERVNELERRFYDVELETREEQDMGVVIGRPIVYGQVANIGMFDEVIMPGALDGADLTDVRLCLNHDTSYVYARSRRNNPNSTMRLTPDQSGLMIEADLNIKSSPKAQDYYSAIKRGDMDKMSFMFSVREDQWDNLDSDHPLRRITKISNVVEVSAVTFPAYDSTEIDARSKEALENARSAVETARQQREQAVETAFELARLRAKIKSL